MGTKSVRTRLHNYYPIHKEVVHIICGEVGHSRREVGRHVPVLPIHAITYSPSFPLA